MATEDSQNPVDNHQLDLNQIADRPEWKIELKNEDPLELRHRLSIERWDAWFRRGERAVGVITVLAGVSLIVWLCYGVASNPKASADDKRWSTSILASIVSLGAGYLAPKPK
ncbi:hypothetical protein [Altericista sp. CCNU0014]|uniref:hypothetical protein n=1 Tax=Altericista sp. CCNU0014 TaxID=3082949 RepID=UPI0038503172